MIKIIAVLLGLSMSFGYALAADQDAPNPVETCKAQIPYGMPSTNQTSTVICRKAYLVGHNNVGKIPDWVAWNLTVDHVIGCVPRVNAFAADLSLPVTSRSTPADYAGSGYDQGHLANNADMSWSETVAKESFLMSNMSPQLPSVNRGVWKNLESAERAWVLERQHSFTIYAGDIWGPRAKVIGKDSVVVPEYLFKILVDDVLKQSYAFIIQNKDGQDKDFTKYQVTVADVEKASGLTFPVPDKKDVKNPITEPDLKKFSSQKKAECN